MKIRRLNRSILFVVFVLFLGACTTFEYHETQKVSASRYDAKANSEISDLELLDVGVVLFDTGVDLVDDESAAYSQVRQSESVWFASQLKSSLEHSNAWAIVRTMPDVSTAMDITVQGKILESNGEVVELRVSVVDASGRLWLEKHYQQKTSSYSYNPEVSYSLDPFHSLFVRIANDLFDYREKLTSDELKEIRSIAKLRFANDFLPAQYGNYLSNNDGQYSLTREPAVNDPMIMRIDRIRARNDLFLDVVQDYYRAFNGNMAHPYQEWRKTSYKEVIYARQLKEQSRQEKLAGVAAVALGILAQGSNSRTNRIAGHVGIFSGADLIVQGYRTQNEAMIHDARLRELGASLEAELEPSVIDLQERSITLTGTVEDQLQEWRRILKEMFVSEGGGEQFPDLQEMENSSRDSKSREPALE